MKTLGIDLATEPRATATCLIDWDAQTVRIDGGRNDEQLVESMDAADRVGIDAPFGWPDAFRAAIDTWSERGEWTAGHEREPLRLRRTDIDAIQTGARPMSVSTNLLGATAMRCAFLLHEHGKNGPPLDRVRGHAVEVYPAGSLAAWGVPGTRKYKETAAGDQRRAIAEHLQERIGMAFGEAALVECTRSDHRLDALLCSLTTRAVMLGCVREVPDDPRIAREGWIHLPLPGSLNRLARG